MSDCETCRSRFLSVLSHEFRNPLSALSNSLYLLGRSRPGDERFDRAVAVIERQVHQLVALLERVSDVTSLARCKVELNRTPLDLCDLVRRVALDHRDLFAGRRVHFFANLPTTTIYASVDSPRVRQIMVELLQNAAHPTT